MPTEMPTTPKLAGTRLVRTTATIVLRTALEAPPEPWIGISAAQIRQALRAADSLLCFYQQVLATASPLDASPYQPTSAPELGNDNAAIFQRTKDAQAN